ncbi:MAG TPA: hypothetical protein VJQ56_01245 [Blastocatellia bacterium]|nr:hypothetical protein [Blastocatellia bacterium]
MGDPIGTGNISLNVAKPEKAVLARYENGPFSRLDGLDDPNDFRWIVQLDGREFHNRPLPVFRDVFKPIITLNSGLFYTAYRIPVKKIPPRDRQPSASTTRTIPTRVAWFTGVNIYLNADNPEATLSYFDDTGTAKSIKIKNDPGVAYLGYIFNLASAGSHFHEDESDFQYYYDAFDVPLRERFDIRGASEAAASVSTTSVIVSESSVVTSSLIPADFEPRVSPGRPCIQGYLGGADTAFDAE